jgi:hypothetical protein
MNSAEDFYTPSRINTESGSDLTCLVVLPLFALLLLDFFLEIKYSKSLPASYSEAR